MIQRNYRQAKRNREETRKKRQQEKLQRKQSQGTAPAAIPEAGVADDSTPKTTP